jgi:hypothetical protein
MTAVADGPPLERAADIHSCDVSSESPGVKSPPRKPQPLYAEWSRAAIPISVIILASLGQIELTPRGSRAAAEAASMTRSSA